MKSLTYRQAKEPVIVGLWPGGTNDWYPKAQWFLRCYDLQKGPRSFALDTPTLEVLT